jgi:lipopolysaccharide export system ATP-binding protein
VLKIFSNSRRTPPRRDSVAGVEVGAIGLGSIGGAISGTYVDIASLPVRPTKARSKPSPRPKQRERQEPEERQEHERAVPNPPPRPKQRERQEPEDRQEHERAVPNPPPRSKQRERQEPEERQERERTAQNPPPPIVKPTRRSDGNGAARGDRKGVLEVHNVEKSFVGRKVVKKVSLYVRQGEAVGLLGPNGAGKTTVFYMITGLIKADQGRIDLDGHDVTKLPMYQRARLGIGYLPQEASIFRGLSVEQNIRAVLEVVEPDARRRERDLDALLEEFHITRLRKTPSIALSGGERRRVEIARSLATRPNYMLLDEPFAGIDPIAVGDIQALVRHLTNRGIGVLITDHNVRETLGLTDRAYIIYSGEVLMEGSPDDIVNNPDVRRLYLGQEFTL